MALDTASLIANRNKIQFATQLAFGKIAAYWERSFTAAASSTATFSEAHGLSGTIYIFGWAKLSTSSSWIPFHDIAESWGVDSSLAKNGAYFIGADNTNVKFRINNRDASSYTVTFRIWLVVI